MKNKFIDEFKSYHKETVYDYYYGIHPNPLDYEKVTRKVMASEIYDIIKKDIGVVFEMLSFDELELLIDIYSSKKPLEFKIAELPKGVFQLMHLMLIEQVSTVPKISKFTLSKYFDSEIKKYLSDLDLAELKEAKTLKDAIKGYINSVGVVFVEELVNVFHFQYGKDKDLVENLCNSYAKSFDDGLILTTIDFNDKKGVKALRLIDSRLDVIFKDHLEELLFSKKASFKFDDLVMIGKVGYSSSNSYINDFITVCEKLPFYIKGEIIEGAMSCINYDGDIDEYLDFVAESLSGISMDAGIGVKLAKTFFKMFAHAPSIMYSGYTRADYSTAVMNGLLDRGK